jgi:hypothetical protein
MNELLAISHGPLDRPALLSEYLPDQPYILLHEVFFTRWPSNLLKELLSACLNRIEDQDSSATDRSMPAPLAEFYNALPSLIEALDAIGKKPSDPGQSLQTVRNFCSSYSRTFVRRELWCFLNAVTRYGNDNSASIPADVVLDWFEHLSSLIETAYVLDGQEEITQAIK